MITLLTLSVALLGLQASSPPLAGDLDAAFERARAEARPLVLGIYTAGEARSEDFQKRILRAKPVSAALGEVVFVQALLGQPSKSDARRFGELDVDGHARLVLAARDRLPSNAEGVLASPQHTWFAPDGRVLLAAPFELEPEEFLWLDGRARQLLASGDTEGPPSPMPEGARAPRRYLLGAAFAPADGDRFGRGLLPDEVEVELETLRKRGSAGGGGGRGGGGLGGGGRGGGAWNQEAIEAIVRLAFTDTKDAQAEVKGELGNVFLRFGGSTALLDAGLEIVAYAAPRRGVETVSIFVSDTVPALRARAASALEAMGFEGDGWSDLRKAFEKESDPAARRAQLRAIGVVGRGESAARRILEKEALKSKNAADRAAALIGLGHFGDAAAVEDTLRACLGDMKNDLAFAAAAAMALTRDRERFHAAIVERATGLEGADADSFRYALQVLDGAPTVALRPLLERAAPDEFPRPRLFFESRPAANAGGNGFLRGGRGGRDGGDEGGGAGQPGGGGGAP